MLVRQWGSIGRLGIANTRCARPCWRFLCPQSNILQDAFAFFKQRINQAHPPTPIWLGNLGHYGESRGINAWRRYTIHIMIIGRWCSWFTVKDLDPMSLVVHNAHAICLYKVGVKCSARASQPVVTYELDLRSCGKLIFPRDFLNYARAERSKSFQTSSNFHLCCSYASQQYENSEPVRCVVLTLHFTSWSILGSLVLWGPSDCHRFRRYEWISRFGKEVARDRL
jgi:hypothetical protein